MMLAHLAFALATVGSQEPSCPPEYAAQPWEELRALRRAALRADAPERVRTLVRCELAAARGVVVRRPELGLEPVCMPFEVDFHVCNELRPEWGCARDVLARYVAEGCLADPYEVRRYHRLASAYWRRRLDLVQAKRHLDEAATSVQALLLRRLLLPEERPDVTLTHLLRAMAIHAGERAELAALLRDAPATRHHADEVAGLVPLLSPDMARNIAELHNQVGWSFLLAREAQVDEGDVALEPEPWLHAALQTFTGSDPDPRRADNVRINLVLAALQRDDLADARRWIAEIVDEEEMSAEERMWYDLVRIREAAASGRTADALALHAQLFARPFATGVPMAGWHAAVVRGQLLEPTDPEQALAAYTEAEATLEAHARGRPGAFGALADGRYMFFAAGTRRLIALLHARDGAGAARVARRARNRATRMTLAARCPDAAPDGETQPPDGEVRLLFTRVAERGDTTTWIGFAVDTDSVTSHALELPPVPRGLHTATDDALQPWSDALLAPFAEVLDAAKHLVVLPTEELHAVPFHALPWDGGLLVEAVPVTYGLDWAGCAHTGAHPAATPHTLILRGDSPRLAAEVDDVTGLLRAAGQAVTPVAVAAAADFQALTAATFTAAHIAAHGDHHRALGLLESDDRLIFSDDLWRSRDDILALSRVPPFVSLSACQSSFVDTETLGGGISVVHAFLLAGAQFVAGSTHDVDDLVASAFSVQLHTELAAHGHAEAPAAWQAAYMRVRDEFPPSQHPNLRMLRLYVP